MSEKPVANRELSQYLRQLANKIDADRVSNEDLRTISEIRMRIEGSKSLMELDEETIKKYLFTGWWIHQNIPSSTLVSR